MPEVPPEQPMLTCYLTVTARMRWTDMKCCKDVDNPSALTAAHCERQLREGSTI